ncbi:MAG: FTR1 family protein [bacterium JZ-2024 1]
MTLRIPSSMTLDRNIAKPIALSGICLFFCSYARTAHAQDPIRHSQTELAHRAIRLIDLSLREYNLGVSEGVIVNPIEYDEALVFLRLAESLTASLSPDEVVRTSFKTAIAAAEAKSSLATVSSRVAPARAYLVKQFGAPLIEAPYGVNAEIGMALFRSHCEGCHQAGGRRIRDRYAPDLMDREFLEDLSPLQMVTVITEGVPDSPMAGWAGQLSSFQIWCIVYGLLAHQFGPPPDRSELGNLPSPDPSKSYTDWLKEITSGLGIALEGRPEETARKALLRPLVPSEDFTERLVAFATKIASLAQQLPDSAGVPDHQDTFALLYTEFESLEGPLLARNISLGTLLEARFQRLLRNSKILGTEALRPELLSLADSLRSVAEAPPPSSRNAFAQSFLILLREGLEVLLLISSLLAVLKRLGAGQKAVYLWFGVLASIMVTALLAAGLRWLIVVSSFQVLAEGLVLIVGSVVLIYVVVWMSRHLQLARLKEEFQHIVHKTSSGFPLAVASFMVVSREGLETVLFYQALFIYTGNAWKPVVLGAVCALGLLTVLGYLILKLAVRMPLKWFFTVSGTLLFLLAISFLGKGIFALQTAGWIPMTVLRQGITIDWLGIYPVTQTLAAQLLMIILVTYLVLAPIVTRRTPSTRSPYA